MPVSLSALKERECRFSDDRRPALPGSSSDRFRFSNSAAFSACLRVTASFSRALLLSHRCLAVRRSASSCCACVSGACRSLIFSRCLSLSSSNVRVRVAAGLCGVGAIIADARRGGSIVTGPFPPDELLLLWRCILASGTSSDESVVCSPRPSTLSRRLR